MRYYIVSEVPMRYGERKGTIVWAENALDAKKAWRYIHNREGRSLYVQRALGPNNEKYANQAIRHAKVMLGEWEPE